jgi:hypothetical protein
MAAVGYHHGQAKLALKRAGHPAGGNALLPMAAGQAHGTEFREALIAGALRTGGGALIITAVRVLALTSARCSSGF